MTPRSSASARPIDGRCALSSSFSNSPQMRSAGRSSSGIVRHNAAVSSSSANSNRAENCTARSTRRLSSPKVRQIDRAQQTAFEIDESLRRIFEFGGQRIPGDRVDREIAPAGGLGERHERVAFDPESLVSAALLRLPPRQRHVDIRAVAGDDLVDGKRLPDRFDPSEPLQQRRQAIAGMPKTSRSMSFDSRFSSRSRTQPPTISARPPASRTAEAIVRRDCGTSKSAEEAPGFVLQVQGPP